MRTIAVKPKNNQIEIAGLQSLMSDTRGKEFIIVGDRHDSAKPTMLAQQIISNGNFDSLFLENANQGSIKTLAGTEFYSLFESQNNGLVRTALSMEVKVYGLENSNQDGFERIRAMAEFIEEKKGKGSAVITIGREHIRKTYDIYGARSAVILPFLLKHSQRDKILTIVPETVCDPTSKIHSLQRKETVDIDVLLPKLEESTSDRACNAYERKIKGKSVDWIFLLPYDEKDCKNKRLVIDELAKQKLKVLVRRQER